MYIKNTQTGLHENKIYAITIEINYMTNSYQNIFQTW